MLEVTPAAPARTGDRAADRNPVGRGVENLDRITAPETRVTRIGQPDPDAFPRQSVPDEDDPSVVPGHAVAAVGDGSDLDRSDDLPKLHQQQPIRIFCGALAPG